jgi:hypothetical protein
MDKSPAWSFQFENLDTSMLRGFRREISDTYLPQAEAFHTSQLPVHFALPVFLRPLRTLRRIAAATYPSDVLLIIRAPIVSGKEVFEVEFVSGITKRTSISDLLLLHIFPDAVPEYLLALEFLEATHHEPIM